MLVRDVMREDVVVVSPDDDVVSVGDALVARRHSSAVVASDGRVVGMVSKESFLTSVKYVGTNALSDYRVADFMEKSVECVSPEDDVVEAVDKLLYVPYRIDRIPVLSGGDIAGILSKGDLVSAFSEEFRGRFKVKDLMEYKPVVAYDYMTIPELLGKLELSGEKRVLVMEGARLVGVVTILDLSMALFKKKKEFPGEDVFSLLSVEEVMTKNPVTTKSRVDAAEAAKVMVDKKIGGLPVYDKELSGLISKTDVIKGYKIAIQR